MNKKTLFTHIALAFACVVLIGLSTIKAEAFEKSTNGAKTYAVVNGIVVRKSASAKGARLKTVNAGTKMIAQGKEKNGFCKVKVGGKTGWVDIDDIMINLPDVYPSIQFKITNASKSIYKCSGYSISKTTGKKLYSGAANDTKYAPLMYRTAKRLDKARKSADSAGYTLRVYDSYRPYSVTKNIYTNFLHDLSGNSKKAKAMRKAVNGSGMTQNNFLAPGVSSHNRGVALDVTMVNKKTGKEAKMQSNMHELSTKSIPSKNNAEAKKLRKFFVNAGFTPLKSEWWHFDCRSTDWKYGNQYMNFSYGALK